METKLLFVLAFIAALLIGGWWLDEHAYHSGLTAGKAEVQTAWDQDKAAIEKLDEAAIAKANKDRDDALATNEGIQNDLQTQLATARALNTDLAQRLRAYEISSTARGNSVSEARGGPDTPTAAVNASLGRLDDATAAALSECAANRTNQIALIGEIVPQL
jgi:hypothetical protein